MAKYVLSTAAQASLRDISARSIESFGVNRTKVYLNHMRDRMQALAINPLLGKARDELKLGFYSSYVGSHTIYYRIQPNQIEIIDVLHQAMEPSKHIDS